jgi:hypothetical protein
MMCQKKWRTETKKHPKPPKVSTGQKRVFNTSSDKGVTTRSSANPLEFQFRLVPEFNNFAVVRFGISKSNVYLFVFNPMTKLGAWLMVWIWDREMNLRRRVVRSQLAKLLERTWQGLWSNNYGVFTFVCAHMTSVYLMFLQTQSCILTP